MAKYKKKPIIVEAYQTDKELIIHTLEGDMKANVGDYIITGVNGEQYPCKPDVFELTYEPLTADDVEAFSEYTEKHKGTFCTDKQNNLRTCEDCHTGDCSLSNNVIYKDFMKGINK